MKRTEFWNSLTAGLLSAVIALCGVGCLITGFGIEPEDLAHTVCILCLYAAGCALCCRLRWGLPAFGLGSLLLLAAQLRWGRLLLSLEWLLNHITQFYNRAYGWGYIRWSTDSLLSAAPDGALILLGCLVILAVAIPLSRRKWMPLSLLVGFLPLALCCVVIDTVPHSGFLFPLLGCLLLMALTQRLRKVSLSDANRVTALLLVPVLLFTGLVFRWEPADGYQAPAQALLDTLQGWAADIGSLLPPGWVEIPGVTVPGETGSGSQVVVRDMVDLTDAGPNHLGDHMVMEIHTYNTNGLLYLRGRSYDRYTGAAWASIWDTQGENGWPTDRFSGKDLLRIQTARLQPILYFTYYFDNADWTSQLVGGALPNDDKLMEYTTDLYHILPNRNAKPTALTDQEWQIYTVLPEQTMTAAQQLLRGLGISTVDPTAMEPSQWFGDSGYCYSLTELSNYDFTEIAAAITDYVRRSALYDLNTERMPDSEEDFALWFLEDSPTGYCVHYASAAAVLLRAAGIPARYVSGYLTYVAAGKDCLVPAGQAHAWVEYYHPQLGWTVLDATPNAPSEPVYPAPDPTEPPTEPQPTTEPPTESTAPTLPNRPTLPSTGTEPTDPPVTPTVPAPQPGVTETVAPTEPSGGAEPLRLNLQWMKLLGWIALAWLAIAGQYKLRIRLRKKRLHTGTANQQAIKAWRYVRQLSRISGHSAKELLPLAEKAAFSQHQLTQEELACFEGWFREADQALLQKPWLTQFLLRLIFAVE